MYVPSHFEETRTEVLHQLVRDHPFAVLVAHTPGGLEANHLPLELVGKWKVSQNRSEADRAGVATGLRELGDPEAAAMAELVGRSSDP